MVTESRWTLVGKIRVRVCGRAKGLVKRVAFGGGGGAAEAADGGEELGLAELCGSGGVVAVCVNKRTVTAVIFVGRR